MATISFETNMTIDNEEQMKILLEAVEEAEKRGPLATLTPEETKALMLSDLKRFQEYARKMRESENQSFD